MRGLVQREKKIDQWFNFTEVFIFFRTQTAHLDFHDELKGGWKW
jgi:hypothetical protein